MSYFQICCKDIVNSIIDYFYPNEVLGLIDVLRLSIYQRKLYYKRNVSKIPGSLKIDPSSMIIMSGDDSKYEILLIKLTYDNKINIHQALCRFSKLGNLRMAKYLVSIGADIHTAHDGPIRGASANGHLGVIEYLISVGANIHADNDKSLINASAGGHLEVVQYLASLGADLHTYNDSPIKWASYYGHLDIVKYLVSQGADIHVDSDWPMRYASKFRNLDLVEYLVFLAASIRAHNN